MNMRRRAHLRMVTLTRVRDTLRTVEGVEQRTSMNDARTALCVAMGVELDDINPASGHDMSRRAYESSRKSWVDHIAMFGFSEFYDGPHLAKALDNWSAWNPAYTDGDDWLAAGSEAHHVRQKEIGRPCDRGSCDLHPASETEEPS